MSILQRIIETKRDEVSSLRPWAAGFRAAAADTPPPLDLSSAIRGGDAVSLLAEVKRRSPGAGEIRPGLNAAGMAVTYRDAGAAAVSVLTDGKYFGGSLDDLRSVREAVDLPLLRKDFVVDPVQVDEARSAGADAVLLIVAVLDETLLADLRSQVEESGMTALVEVHTPEELERAIEAGATVVGINNRDLRIFETSLDVTLDLLPEVPPGVVVVSESGIRDAEDVDRLGKAGVDAVLVGEALLLAPDPGAAARGLVGRPRGERDRGTEAPS